MKNSSHSVFNIVDPSDPMDGAFAEFRGDYHEVKAEYDRRIASPPDRAAGVLIFDWSLFGGGLRESHIFKVS